MFFNNISIPKHFTPIKIQWLELNFHNLGFAIFGLVTV